MCLATAAVMLVPVPAGAQDADEAKTAEAAGIADEIVVTARKREEGLQDVPLSVQAFSGATLERAGIRDFYTSKLDLFGTIYGTYIPPRTYGITGKWRF